MRTGSALVSCSAGKTTASPRQEVSGTKETTAVRENVQERDPVVQERAPVLVMATVRPVASTTSVPRTAWTGNTSH